MGAGRMREPAERLLLAEKKDQDKGKQHDIGSLPHRALFRQGAKAAWPICLGFSPSAWSPYRPHCLPLLYLAHRRLPQGLIDWLSFIPVAILSALLAPILFTDSATRSLDLGKPELLVAVPTLLFAWKTKSLGSTVILGMLLFWLVGKVC